MSYAEANAEAEANSEAEASLSRSDSVSGFGVFVMFFPRFDDRIPAPPRPPPRSLHSAAAAAATSNHFLDIYLQPEHEGQGIDLLSGDVKGQKGVGTEQCQSSQSLFEGGRMARGDARQQENTAWGIAIAGAHKAQKLRP